MVNAKDYATSVSIGEEENGVLPVYYSFISGDYQNTMTYTINYTNLETSAINGVNTSTKKSATGIYDLSGRRVKYDNQHGIYIVRTADGKTFKIKK